MLTKSVRQGAPWLVALLVPLAWASACGGKQFEGVDPSGTAGTSSAAGTAGTAGTMTDGSSTCGELVCQNTGQCVTSGGAPHCECAPGFGGDECEQNVDDCASAPCQNGGVCGDRVGDYICACPSGFTGKSCETKATPCEPSPCQSGGTCAEEAGTFVCSCAPGFADQRQERGRVRGPAVPKWRHV